MLSYAFQTLNEQGYKRLATEEFHNVADLCSAILCQGVSQQIKRGLGREYIERTESLSSPRGKLEIAESIKTKSMLRKQLVCTYDDFSVNSYMNRIIKSTMLLLLKNNIDSKRKKLIRKLLVYFGDVDILDVHNINWNIQYNRNNQTYHMLISICWLIIKGLLQTTSDGSTKLMDYLDEQRMSHLYEKFILEFYRKEFPDISVNASQIPWIVDDGFKDMLPVMQSDIMLEKDDKILIIDAKYYSHSTQQQYDKHTLHSNNLYQIFTYVKNKAAACAEKDITVSGLLLYAKTDIGIEIDKEYLMSGNRIGARTLDLNYKFSDIAEQLSTIINSCF
jgi:5-methylcytosine-specific restriction enzyme subunit McrC